VAHPQIAAFARLANGGQPPARTVFGQASKLSRTMHDIRYDEIHDEFLVVNPFAEAILTFRGGSSGQEGPIRIIQGPHAKIGGSRMDVDPVHNEIFVPDNNKIRVYAREANGDTSPIRIIEGPDTQLVSAESLSVDPFNNILVVGFNKGEGERDPDGAILIFNRTDNGNVKPRAVIRGPKSGIIRINQMAVNPARRLIVAAMPGHVEQMEPADAFLGVWTYDDNGDVAPKWKIPVGPRTTLKKPFGVVLNTKNKEVIISDMRMNGVLTFSGPEIF
jgi:hypothetical protein